MRSNDIKTRDEIRARMQQALRGNDTEGFYAAFDEMLGDIEQNLRQEYADQLEEVRQEMDGRILAARGVRQLTSAEREYYQKFAAAARSDNPQQAVANLDVALPETVINSVFDDMRANHPLLSKINFMPSGGAVKILVNTNGVESAVWGKLTDEVVKEATAGLKEIDTVLYKLSAFLPVAKAMLDLGPDWLDRFVRETLYEYLSNGLEVGIVTGEGKDQPIGMMRKVGDDVNVTGGRYPKKDAITLNDLSPATVGNLISLMAVTPNGRPRTVSDVIFLVNPQDYYQKVMPATTVQAPDGTYRNDVLPYPMTVIQSPALKRGEALMGIAGRYKAFAGLAKDGRIEYSDDYHFLEDERVYLIKTYANGMPLDNNAFLLLNISGLRPAVWKVETADAPTPGTNAALNSLSLGSVSLSPAFSAATVTYTAATTNATNTITAVPADAAASVKVEVGGKEIDNGSAATWASGANTVKVTVTAEDGTTTKTYTVTVTKS